MDAGPVADELLRPQAVLVVRAPELAELAAKGVDDAAVHEIPALPSDEEVAAIAAEQEAGAAEAEAAAEAAETPAEENQDSDAAGETPAADESKEG